MPLHYQSTLLVLAESIQYCLYTDSIYVIFSFSISSTILLTYFLFTTPTYLPTYLYTFFIRINFMQNAVSAKKLCSNFFWGGGDGWKQKRLQFGFFYRRTLWSKHFLDPNINQLPRRHFGTLLPEGFCYQVTCGPVGRVFDSDHT